MSYGASLEKVENENDKCRQNRTLSLRSRFRLMFAFDSQGSTGDVLSLPSTKREAMQWKSIFAGISIEGSNEPLFANYGSHTMTEEEPSTITDDLIQSIATQFGQDVFNELAEDLQPETSKRSKTSKGSRVSFTRARPEHITPIPANRTTKLGKMNRMALMVPIVRA